VAHQREDAEGFVMRTARGFSLVELTIVAAVLLVVTGSLLMVSLPSHGLFSAQSEVSDMQQRLRVAADALSRDLIVAGAGGYGPMSGSALGYSLAPVLPYRTGQRNSDPPGTYKADTITILYVPRNTAAIASATYSLKTDASAGTHQLVMYDGTTNPDVPVVDNVVGLSFGYYGDPQPPIMRKALSEPVGPWTTYGAPPYSSAVPPFAAGENCTFINDGSPTPRPRLATFAAASEALVKLTPAQLTDGPWCPNDAAAGRFDADLLRVRRVAVTLRVQAAVAALRGPAGLLFTYAGTARSAATWAPDQELRFDVAPRNLNLNR
jgi:type II secretory pathway pseudopilin PulG